MYLFDRRFPLVVCAGFVWSAAARRVILVGGGAPPSRDRRRRLNVGGGGVRRRQQSCSSYIAQSYGLMTTTMNLKMQLATKLC
jgi:hypothetical protein